MGDEDARKLFLGGLPPQAQKEDVEAYFQQFGEVEMVTIKTDVYTGRSRGFGFLIYKDQSSVSKTLQTSKHEICEKEIEAKLATPQNKEGEMTKVFVGGIDKGTSSDEVKAAFSSRGTVTEVFLPVDNATGQHKGFAFVSFDDSSLASTLCSEGKIIIEGKECDIKKAKSKNESRGGGRGGFRGGRGFFPGGRGGGRGGFGGGYDNYGGGGGYGNGYDNYGSGGYGNGYNQGYSYEGGYSGGYDNSQQSYGGGYGNYGGGNYGHNDQYKMRGNRGGRGGGGYTPY